MNLPSTSIIMIAMLTKIIIQEHNADKAGLHWDLRFEHAGVLKSWAIPKARLPEAKEQLLAMQVSDHPLSWGDFDGIIKEGYGKGSVKLLANELVEAEVSEYSMSSKLRKISFEYGGKAYKLFHAPYLKGKGTYLIRETN
jgi:DNA ligase D-like protein (predicted 3'-phosphoesterase)